MSLTAIRPVCFPDYPHQLDLGRRRKRLLSPYRYEWTEHGVHYRLTAPKGFEHDGASVPRIVWSLLPPHSLDRSAVFHDLAYQRGGEFRPGEYQMWMPGGDWKDVDLPWSRARADKFFRRLLGEDPKGPEEHSRAGAYWAVRIGGAFGAWKG